MRECLRQLPTRSVHCVVTSPPYHQLRDYGTGSWEGGRSECDHKRHKTDPPKDPTSTLANRSTNQNHEREPWPNNVCGKCGATRTDHQIGMEDTPEEYIATMVDVFSEVRRVLRDDGTVWLNLGDTFDNGQQLIPTRVALALVADGWRLVQDIIWYAPNKMPESVTNRCTKSHEHIFLLAKGNDYYFDSVAIHEVGKSKPHAPGNNKLKVDNGVVSFRNDANEDRQNTVWGDGNVNKRDVWIIPTRGYPGAHFAVFSPDLITPCILAGTSEHGCCAECGSPYERVVTRIGGVSVDGDVESRDRSFPSQRNGLPGSGSTLEGTIAARETVGWRKVCGCQTTDVMPCTVLDPFVGSGTTVATAIQLGRAGVGIDLSEVYLRENAVPRIEAAMRGEKVGSRATVVVPPDVLPSPRRMR